MNAIVTVVGQDRVGIIAAVCTKLAGYHVNILDISQTILQGSFTMVMAVDVRGASAPFGELQSALAALGVYLGLQLLGALLVARETVGEGQAGILVTASAGVAAAAGVLAMGRGCRTGRLFLGLIKGFSPAFLYFFPFLYHRAPYQYRDGKKYKEERRHHLGNRDPCSRPVKTVCTDPFYKKPSKTVSGKIVHKDLTLKSLA